MSNLGLSVDVESFLQSDYETKVRYYSDHMQRVWTRFNFFITLQSGLVAGLVFSRDRGEFTEAAIYFLIAEAVLSFVWYVFGAQDRYVIALYRDHIAETLELLRAREPFASALPDGYPYAGQIGEIKARSRIERRLKLDRRSVVEWRWQPVSLTRLPAVVPLALFLFWIAMIVLYAFAH